MPICGRVNIAQVLATVRNRAGITTDRLDDLGAAVEQVANGLVHQYEVSCRSGRREARRQAFRGVEAEENTVRAPARLPN
jgi:hypothetical protein